MKKQFAKTDIQQEVTNKIVALIEAGNLEPFKCPWTKSGEQAFPYNWKTKQDYNGINILILWMAAMERGFSRNSWLTFQQAKELGGNVIKGESGTRCVFFKPVTVENKDAIREEDKETTYAMLKGFTVFNVEQIEGLEGLPDMSLAPQFSDDELVKAFDNLTEDYRSNTGLEVRYGGERAYYSPTLDFIKLPTTFNDVAGMVSTYAHELGHSTGHKKRLNRFEKNLVAFKGNKDSEYAMDELVAELFSGQICCQLGVEYSYEQHASYIGSWLTHLKNDKTFIFKAAAQASSAYRYVCNGGITEEKVKTESKDAA